MNLNYALKNVRKTIREIIRKDERKIFIVYIIVASIFVVAVVSAAVYTSMSMGSSIGVT